MLALRQFLIRARQTYQELHVSELFDEKGFYPALTKDLKRRKRELANYRALTGFRFEVHVDQP